MVRTREPFSGGCLAQDALAALAGLNSPDGVRASLLLGWCLAREGRAREALVLLDRAQAHPTLAPYARLWSAEAALRLGDPAGARRRLLRAIHEGLAEGALLRARLLLVEAALALRLPHEAEVHAQEALARARLDEERAWAWWWLGQVAEFQGVYRKARTRYAMAWWAFPGAEGSGAAWRRLRSLGPLPEPPLLARVERARRLSDPQEALREWQAALRQGLPRALQAEAHLQLGLLQLGSAKAVESLTQVVSDPRYGPQARYWLGVAYARLGQDATAARTWEGLVRRFPDSPWTARALLALASQAERQGDRNTADRWLLRAAAFPTATGERARWKRGWLRYQQGRYAEAELLWQQAWAHSLFSRSAPEALYWAALARSRRGLPARPLFEKVAQRYPHTYYGQKAREKLGLPAPPPPPPPTAWELPRHRYATRPVELAALGFYDEAEEEARVVAQRTSSQNWVRLLAWVRAQVGAVRGSVEAVEALVSRSFRSAELDRELWSLAYPLAHWALVEESAREHRLDPFLLLAVMREESRFDPQAVSRAGAVGLMQLLPSTARGLDPSVGIADLTDPHTNVRLGAAYLAARLREFGGDVLMALIAYNAGPAAARRFLSLRKDSVDEFVERIPYAETRAYVKRVLETYGIYRWLYRPDR